MHFKIDEFHSEQGFVQKINPAVKLGFIFLVPTACAVIPPEKTGASFLILLLSLILLKFSKIPMGILLKRMVPMLPFLIYPAILIFHAFFYGHNLFMSENSSIYNKFIDFFGYRIEFPASEVSFSINLLLKSLATVNTVIVFTAATRFKDLAGALEAFGFPRYFIMVFSSTWRYLEALVNETIIMRTASSFRFFRPANIFSIKTFSFIFGSVFLRSLRRADMNNISMKFRGYRADTAAGAGNPVPVNASDAAFVLITAAFITFACFLI